MNIAEILKECPEGTKLYSPIFGEVSLVRIQESLTYPIFVRTAKGSPEVFTSDGKLYYDYDINTECLLFPSKENRDWSTFKVPKKEYSFKPFDRVLVRDADAARWEIDLFSHYEGDINEMYRYSCFNGDWRQCIPYKGNEHLLCTNSSPD